jgi:hypothetical protein
MSAVARARQSQAPPFIDPRGYSRQLGEVYRTISRHLIGKAGLTRTTGATGAVTLVQRFAQIVQSQRDDRIVCRPSTAHRVDGTPIARNKIAGAKRQRDLSEDDLNDAIKSTHAWPKGESSGLPSLM